jgi:hypothetical protein
MESRQNLCWTSNVLARFHAVPTVLFQAHTMSRVTQATVIHHPHSSASAVEAQVLPGIFSW